MSDPDTHFAEMVAATSQVVERYAASAGIPFEAAAKAVANEAICLIGAEKARTREEARIAASSAAYVIADRHATAG